MGAPTWLVTVVHTRSLITDVFWLMLMGGGNRLTLAGRLEGGNKSVGVGKA